MSWRLPLQLRVTLGFAVVGAAVAGAVAVGAYRFTLSMEQRLVAETLTAELNYTVERQRDAPGTPPPAGQGLRTWVMDAADDLPPVLRTLPEGFSQIRFEQRGWFVEVREVEGRRYVVALDDAQIRHREEQLRGFLVIAGLVTIFLAAILGGWLAWRTLAPLRQLARLVTALRPDQALDRRAIPPAHDEIEHLLRAFGDYQVRLLGYIARERAFTGDASHELRTPLSVIRGAAEVLLESPDLTPAQQRPVDRIARAVHEIERLITALLALAREEGLDDLGETCFLDQVTRNAIEQLRPLLAHKPVQVDMDLDIPVELRADRRLVGVVVANLIRNAFSYIREGHVQVAVNADGLTVRDTGPGIPDDLKARVFTRHVQGARSEGAGIGLALARRICDHYGWRLELDSREGEGTEVRLRIS